ncbi:Pentatricopeptide repeat [Trema orientale]|uniref:Pentatricopeptide repeat n=1 Tax=Trema orientale TaxID=63057 RepID=A0A2P5BGT1_TREOI|nr:Pentatricopeptide repeat [Trema orientale]
MTIRILKRHLQLRRFHPSIAPFSSSSSKPVTLTQDELTKINLLLPRLCLSNHLNTATHLAVTALLTNPPPNSLSLSALLDSLASQPDMARPMSLLTRLRHAPLSHRQVAPITATLVAAYFKKGKAREALKVFNWMVRPGSPWELEEKICGVLISGFCRNGMVLEALKVLRAMAAANVEPRGELRELVYRGLLREARVREAMELNAALEFDCDEGRKKVLELLDRMIENWSE